MFKSCFSLCLLLLSHLAYADSDARACLLEGKISLIEAIPPEDRAALPPGMLQILSQVTPVKDCLEKSPMVSSSQFDEICVGMSLPKSPFPAKITYMDKCPEHPQAVCEIHQFKAYYYLRSEDGLKKTFDSCQFQGGTFVRF